MTQQYKLVFVAQVLAGAFAEGAYPAGAPSPSVSITTYGSLESFLKSEAEQLDPDAWIVDARSVPEELAIRESVSGPMVKGSLLVDQGTGAFHYVTPKTKALRWEAIGATVCQARDIIGALPRLQ